MIFPFGTKPYAQKHVCLNLAENAQKEVYYEIDDFEEQTGFAIDSNWLNELALHTQIVVKISPLCYAHSRVLFSALSKYLAKDLPDSSAHLTIWEIGFARGFSAICMAKALDVQNRSGTISLLMFSTSHPNVLELH